MYDDDSEDAIGYALAKQLRSAYALATDYGEFPLDTELREAVDRALRPLLERRLKKLQTADSTSSVSRS